MNDFAAYLTMLLVLFIAGPFFATYLLGLAILVLIPYIIYFALIIGIIFLVCMYTSRKSIQAAIILLLVLISYVLLTPDGAVRAAVLVSGHPIKAITLSSKKYENETVHNETGAQSMCRITKNAPVNRDGEELNLWEIDSFLIFRTARRINSEYFNRISAYSKLFNIDNKNVTVYKPYEDFSIHGHDFTTNDVIVLVFRPDGHDNETKLVAYTPNGRIEEILYDSEREPIIYEAYADGKTVEIDSLDQWFYQLPLTTREFYNENNSGATTSSEVFDVLDPIWSNTTVNYYEIERLLNDVWQISFD